MADGLLECRGDLAMEIAPIPGIRAVAAVKAPPAEGRLTAVFDMEGLARASEDSYTGDGRKSSGGQDDDAEDLASSAEDDGPPRRVSLFA